MEIVILVIQLSVVQLSVKGPTVPELVEGSKGRLLDRHFPLNGRPRVVILKREVIKFEAKNVVDLRIDFHRGQRPWCAR